MRTFYSNDFTGHYPVGSALVVVARDREKAQKIAEKICKKYNLVFDGTLDEIFNDIEDGYMLVDGDY